MKASCNGIHSTEPTQSLDQHTPTARAASLDPEGRLAQPPPDLTPLQQGARSQELRRGALKDELKRMRRELDAAVAARSEAEARVQAAEARAFELDSMLAATTRKTEDSRRQQPGSPCHRPLDPRKDGGGRERRSEHVPCGGGGTCERWDGGRGEPDGPCWNS